MKKLLWGTIFFATFLFPALNASAQTAGTQTGNCVLNQADFDKLQAVQNDPTLSYIEEVKAELSNDLRSLWLHKSRQKNSYSRLQKYVFFCRRPIGTCFSG